MRASLETFLFYGQAGVQLWLERLGERGRRLSAVAGLVVFCLFMLAGTAHASAELTRPSSGVSFYGMTASEGPLVVQTSKDGRVITRAIGAIDLQCNGGPMGPYSFTIKDLWTDVIVSLGGRFSQTYTDTDTEGDVKLDLTGEFSGRFDRRRKTVTGTWREQYVSHFPDGSVSTCDSGLQKFSARRLQK